MRILVLFCLFVLGFAQKLRYDGHKVFTVYPKTEEHVEVLEIMREFAMFRADFWSSPHIDQGCDVHINPEYEEAFLKHMGDNGIEHKISVDNIQALIDAEESANNEARRKRSTSSYSSIVGTFARTAQMDSFMKKLAKAHSHVTLVDMGESFERRTVYGVKISSGPGKQVVWVDAGIHAREWLAQASAIWMLNEMATKYGSDAGITKMVDKYDWYFFPNVNPDGYEYSHSYERMWRKTRSDHAGPFMCIGADANRNFDFPQFGGPGTSSIPCSDQYKGVNAFSEVESANIRDYVNKLKGDMKMFFTLHAYSQLLMVPWGYQKERPDDWQELDRVAEIGASALSRVHSKTFTVGTPPALLYAAAGGSFDWVKGEAGVKYAYAFELRPKSGAGFDGFIVQTSEIEPSGQEVLAAIFAMVNAA